MMLSQYNNPMSQDCAISVWDSEYINKTKEKKKVQPDLIVTKNNG